MPTELHVNVEIADVLDAVSQEFVQIAQRVWAEGRKRRNADEISREQYDEVQAQCRALLRQAVEIVATASRDRLLQVHNSVEELREITARLKQAKERVERTQHIVEAAITAVTAVALVVAAVAAPNPATIGGAVTGVASFVTATAAAATDN